MGRSFRVGRVAFHPSTLAVFAGLIGAGLGFLLNVAAGGNSSQLLWIGLVFALLVSLSLTAWQEYTQEKSGQQWMTMMQEMVFQTYFLTVLADKPEVSQMAQQRFGQVLKTLGGDQQVSMLKFFGHNGLPATYIGDALRGSSTLVGADLQAMGLPGIDLDNANLSRVNLSLANLSDATLNDTSLHRADLSGADLSRSRITNAYLRGVNLHEANLSGADLSGSFIGTEQGRDASAAPTGTALRPQIRANLSNALLPGARLRATTLIGADLSGANLRGADLSMANLSRANLEGADLAEANLTEATLIGANLQKADLSGSTLTWANLDDADMRTARVTDEQIQTAASSKGTKRS